MCTVSLGKCYRGDQTKEWYRWGTQRAKGEVSSAYKILIGIPGKERPVGRPVSKWENIIKVHREAVWCDSVDWMNFVEDWALLNTAANRADVLPSAGGRLQPTQSSVPLFVTSANFSFSAVTYACSTFSYFSIILYLLP